MYVNSFAKTLKRLERRLDYVQECNVNYLHLMPLLSSPKGRSDGGYAVADFRSVQEELGTMEDFSHVTAECHKRGINVCLDFVMNHTSEDHQWAKCARAGEKEYQEVVTSSLILMMYRKCMRKPVLRSFRQLHPETSHGWRMRQKHVMTTFYPYQWDLNYRNPVVLNEMIFNMLYLANQGVDIVRLDAVPYIWKQLGTNCRKSSPGTHHCPHHASVARSYALVSFFWVKSLWLPKGSSLLRYSKKTRVPSSLQCDHYGKYLAYRCYKRCFPGPPSA